MRVMFRRQKQAVGVRETGRRKPKEFRQLEARKGVRAAQRMASSLQGSTCSLPLRGSRAHEYPHRYIIQKLGFVYISL